MSPSIVAGGVVLPPPVEITIEDEIIWSRNTGRGASGRMIGDVVAEKKNISIKWAFLQEEEVILIQNHLIAGFFPVTFYDHGQDITVQVYRGTFNKVPLGSLSDGIRWYKSVSVNLIEQ